MFSYFLSSSSPLPSAFFTLVEISSFLLLVTSVWYISLHGALRAHGDIFFSSSRAVGFLKIPSHDVSARLVAFSLARRMRTWCCVLLRGVEEAR